jgi:hypothetical protein
MKYAVHMTDTERATLKSRLADAEKRVSERSETPDVLAVLIEESRALRHVLAWAEGTRK